MKKAKEIFKANQILTIPNLLSLVRLALIPIMIWLYVKEQEYLWTGILIILSGLTDVVDGFIARRFNMVSDLGKILDPIADKLTQCAMLFCLLTRFYLMALPIVLMVCKEIFMLITGYLVIKFTDNVYSAKWHGKVATALLYAMMLLHVFWYSIPLTVSTIIILISASAICLSFIMYGIYNIQVILFSKKKQVVSSEVAVTSDEQTEIDKKEE